MLNPLVVLLYLKVQFNVVNQLMSITLTPVYSRHGDGLMLTLGNTWIGTATNVGVYPVYVTMCSFKKVVSDHQHVALNSMSLMLSLLLQNQLLDHLVSQP